MAKYLNFFETIHEAQMRLRGTTVLYDGIPYNVLGIANHSDDGVFRAYLEPIGKGERGMSYNNNNPPPLNQFSSDDPELGIAMDEWLKKNAPTDIICAKMDSPLFDRFRPFPLGMCNNQGQVIYIERTPTRKSEQGLTFSMLSGQILNLVVQTPRTHRPSELPDFHGPEFKDCILGEHPSAQECLDALLDPDVTNNGAAFHRHFAFMTGPLGMIFLAYKQEVIGVLPNKNLATLRLGRSWSHTKEVIELLNIFQTIETD